MLSSTSATLKTNSQTTLRPLSPVTNILVNSDPIGEHLDIINHCDAICNSCPTVCQNIVNSNSVHKGIVKYNNKIITHPKSSLEEYS
jgi:hypothetical protein